MVASDFARTLGRSLAALAALVAPLSACVGLLDESNRACPCAHGEVCCASTNRCLPLGASCPALPETPPTVDASFPSDAGADVPTPSLSSDSGAVGTSDAIAPACGAARSPVIHFAFDDCDATLGARFADTASGMLGVRQGTGVRCTRGPLGPALAFDPGDAGDGGVGAYVRVMDSPDASDHVCTGQCAAPPRQFGSAITISVALEVESGPQFGHILGQWYDRDSYMLLTEPGAGPSTQKMEFWVQPSAPDAGLLTVAAPFAVGAWIHWTSVFDGRSLKLYADGKPVASTAPVDAGPLALQCTDVPLEIGQIGRAGPCGGDIDYAFFHGAIGDLQVFDVALSDDEVAALDCAVKAKARPALP
jgi:hypothetical protein